MVASLYRLAWEEGGKSFPDPAFMKILFFYVLSQVTVSAVELGTVKFLPFSKIG